MIVTRLEGGLGNQMFQYAAGLRLACVRGTTLGLDLSLLEAPVQHCATPRSYELGPLRVSARRASPEQVEALVDKRRGAFARWLPDRLTPARRAAAAVERHYHFDPEVLELPDDVCLRGYWQSERYFADAAERVRSELSVRAPASGRNAELAAAIAACEAVSLHVRRGDYVSDATTNAVHGVCSLDYYRRAVAHVASRVTEPHFFLFSDDPEWTREHLRLDAPTTVVDHNDAGHGHEDLRLMSRCRHHVLANSSFSWWGAWLGTGPDRIVVAPRRWFRDETKDTSDLLPSAWVRL